MRLRPHYLHRSVRAATQLLERLGEIGNVLLAVTTGKHGLSDRSANKRLTLVQFGDYADAYWRFANNGPETYYAQKFTVDYIASLASREDIESLSVVFLSANSPEVSLPNGVHTLGVELFPKGRPASFGRLVDAVKKTRPTHLIVMSPCIALIAWGVRTGIQVLPMFADSFHSSGLMAKMQYRLLALLLNASSIEFVANHNLAASLDLKRIGVDSRKILPFDLPAVITPRSYAAKSAPPVDRPFRLLYVGSLIVAKGVGDAIQAVSKLRTRGRQVELTIIGRGESEFFEHMAVAAKVDRYVFFLGSKSHSDVIAAMRDHDAVLVPSHWSYPEGLPMTLYEALCARTPLLASNHPMFALKIHEGDNALVFAERDPEAIADCVDRLASSPDLYARLSAAGEKAAENYLCPLKYDSLISGFLSPTERSRLQRHSLSSQN
jgi:glycosyltransferase involved in cell wall biosynthesis